MVIWNAIKLCLVLETLLAVAKKVFGHWSEMKNQKALSSSNV
jgi:hypothetical protein